MEAPESTTTQEVQITPIEQYAATAKKVFIGSMVAAVILATMWLITQGGATKARKDAITSSAISRIDSFDDEAKAERAESTAAMALCGTYIASGVAGLSCVAFIGSSMLVAYKKS
ncbi:MAG: hypothetical protein SPD80_05765 [Atopobium sp.]|uniref:hypothetical protein n=1 Tax=Atopobium sp. TaxID=1872650 RepID=UPI002A80D89F|nr:hypothetical protein [Atopobium sp.]MDY4523076.1 hypothetical protein [Atopobium sp.]